MFFIYNKMKYIFLIVLLSTVSITSCAEKKKTKVLHIPNTTDTLLEIPNTTVDKSVLQFNNKKSRWTLNNQSYSGYVLSFYPDSTLKEKFGILNGRKQNRAIQWYADGHHKHVTNYQKGKLHGEKKTWSPDSLHTLLSHLNYVSGKAHGEQKIWYPTGELFKKLNLDMGKEEGLQQAFRKNGALFANYEARKGRIFGLKKAALCFGIEDEKVRYKK